MKKRKKYIKYNLIATLFLLLNISSCKENESIQFELLDFNELTNNITFDLSDSFNDQVLISDNAINQEVTMIVELEDSALINYYDYSFSSIVDFYNAENNITRRNNLISKQVELVNQLANANLLLDINGNYDLLLNGISIKANYKDISTISSYDGVKDVYVSTLYQECETYSSNTTSNEISYTNNTKYDGENTIVAVIDSGFNVNHEVFNQEIKNPKLSKNDISSLLNQSKAYELSNESLDINEVYISEKIPFVYDYASKKANVYPISSSHGTHVAGIISGSSSKMEGIAKGSQLALMKVFDDDSGYASSDVILDALEDALLLDVDVINLSLGSTAGYSSEIIPEVEISELSDRLDKIYSKINEAGISVICAAGNDYSASYNNEYGGSNSSSNPDSGNVSAPASYDDSVAVASINAFYSEYAKLDNDKIMFNNVSNSDGDKVNFIKMIFETYENNNQIIINQDGSIDIPFICLDDLGKDEEYENIDVKNKIVIVKRGKITFEEKVNNAIKHGAFAILIYNNTLGGVSATIGDATGIPSSIISLNDGKKLVSKKEGYLTFATSNTSGPYMSSFSSLGPTNDLLIKPEITSFGGNIYSANLQGEYEYMSGTSMACPNASATYLVVRQYLKEKYKDYSKIEIAKLANELIMSSASIIYNEDNNPYSVRKIGAGLIDVNKAINSASYLSVDNNDKVKIELGDDSNKSGEYTFTFNISNTSNNTKSYSLTNLCQSESVDIETKKVLEKGYMLSSNTTFSSEQLEILDNKVIVPGNSSGKITVNIILTNEAKEYLNENFENGTYVEGFISLSSLDNDVDLSIPYLSFYGSWLDAPLFDSDIYDDEESVSLYQTIPYGSYEDYYIIPLGKYIFTLKDDDEEIKADMEKAAISNNYDDAIHGLYSIYTGLLRGADTLNISITNITSGEVVFDKTTYKNRKATYSSSGSTTPFYEMVELLFDDEENEYIFANNQEYEVKMKGSIDYEFGENVKENEYSFKFYCDFEAPTVTDVNYRVEEIDEQTHYFIDLETYDNRYAEAIRPASIIGTYICPLDEYLIPIKQESANSKVTTSIDITNYLNSIYFSNNPEVIYFIIYDYALNYNIYAVPINELFINDDSFIQEEITINVNEKIDLNTLFSNNLNNIAAFEYSVSDDSIANISLNYLYGLSVGETNIVAKSSTFNKKLELKVIVNSDDKLNDLTVEKVSIDAYVTRFSFNDDYEYSDLYNIGSVGVINSDTVFELYPSESFKVYSSTYPSFINENITVKYESSDETLVSVDDGIITALKDSEDEEVTISAFVYIDEKKTDITSSFKIKVKSEYIIEGNTLVYYKGFGNDIIIPEDLKITSIGSYAFSHYNLKEKSEDENEENEEDDSVFEVIGDNTNDAITSITLSSKITSIGSYAFSNLKSLKKVVLNSKLIEIDSSAFKGDIALESINLNNVLYLEKEVFKDCSLLSNVKINSLLSIGSSAFENTGIKEITLSNVKHLGNKAFKGSKLESLISYCSEIGDEAFASCSNLSKVYLYQSNLTIGSNAFLDDTSLETVIYSSSLANLSIKEKAFKNTNLNDLTLPNANITLEDEAFSNANIKTLILSKNTQLTLKGAAFNNNPNFESIILNNNTNYILENKALVSNDKETLILVPCKINYQISDNIKTINTGALAGNTKITKLKLNNLKIDSYAFKGCSLLNNLEISNSIIDDFAFMECQKISQISLDNCELKENIFKDALSYKATLSLTNSSITNETFKDSNLNKVNKFDLENIPSYAFYGCSNLIYFNFTNVKEINDYAFYNTGLVNVDLENIKVIGDYAFKESKIASLNLESIENIGAHAFEKCEDLETVTLNETIKDIKEYTFANSSIKSINLENIENIGDYAFNEASKLKNINLGNAITIGEYAFYKVNANFTNLAKIKEIGDYAFASSNISDINLESIQKIGNYAFASSNLININLGKEVNEINMFSFYNLANLSSITINNQENYETYYLKLDESVLYIKNDTNDLTLLIYPTKKNNSLYYVLDNTTYIAPFAFYNENEDLILEEVFFPSTLKAIGSFAFYKALDLNAYYFESENAPILEGYSLSEAEKMLSDLNKNNETQNNLYHLSGTITNFYADKYFYPYANFKDYVGLASKLSIYYPKDGKGYDSYIYNYYFENKYEAKLYAKRETNALIFALEKLAYVTSADISNKQDIIDTYNKYMAIDDEEQLSLIDASAIYHLNYLYNQALLIKGNVLTAKEAKSLVGKYGLYNYNDFDFELSIDSSTNGYFLVQNRNDENDIHTYVFSSIISYGDYYEIVYEGQNITFKKNDNTLIVSYKDNEYTLVKNATRNLTPAKTFDSTYIIIAICMLGIIFAGLSIIFYLKGKKKGNKANEK